MQISFIKHLVLASFLFLSCNKTEKYKVVKPFISMDINEKTWTPDTIIVQGMYTANYVLEDTAYQININAAKYFIENGNTYFTEKFSIFLVKKILGKQTIYGAPDSEIFYNHRHPTPTTPVYGRFGTRQQYDEFSCEEFMVDSTKMTDNWVEITHQEGNFKRIWGKFNINLKRTGIKNGCTDVKYTDDTKISKGEFYLEL